MICNGVDAFGVALVRWNYSHIHEPAEIVQNKKWRIKNAESNGTQQQSKHKDEYQPAREKKEWIKIVENIF